MMAEARRESRDQKAESPERDAHGGSAALILFSAFCSLLSALPCPVLASGEPDAFALTGVGARAGGMGNAAIGLSDEIETIYYNPAGLGNLVQSGVTAM